MYTVWHVEKYKITFKLDKIPGESEVFHPEALEHKYKHYTSVNGIYVRALTYIPLHIK